MLCTLCIKIVFVCTHACHVVCMHVNCYCLKYINFDHYLCRKKNQHFQIGLGKHCIAMQSCIYIYFRSYLTTR